MKLDLIEGANIKNFEQQVELEMDKQLKHFEKEILKLRTGRANSAMVEDIKVDCYGSSMPLKGTASVTVADATLIIIQPWDKAVIPDIEKAILNSDLGISPVNDGSVIKLQLPQMSAARREDLVKQLHQKLEFCRVAIRNIRKDVHNLIRDAQKIKTISEDYGKRLADALQKSTDKLIILAEKISTKKEADIRS